MHVRVGIDGLGRTGRAVLRAVLGRAGTCLEVAAVNDPAPVATLAYLLRHDSTSGRWSALVEHDGRDLEVDGHAVRCTHRDAAADLDWSGAQVDVVLEATGRRHRRADAAGHLAAGARKVVVAAPGADADVTVVSGVNDDDYSPREHDVVSNASPTTHCAAPMLDVLHRAFGVRRALLTTMHAYTADQNLLDGDHTDLRRTRSAPANLIPTGTGAALAVEAVLPALRGRVDAAAVRVPLPDVSLVDLTAVLDDPATVGQVNRAFLHASGGPLGEVLRYTEEPTVSHDVLGDPASCVFDAGLTLVTGELVKVFGWYDNEWAYARRTVELLETVARTLPPR